MPRSRSRGQLAAALLYAGPGAALSHTTAAWWWGLIEAEPRVVHVATRRRRAARKGLRLHRVRRVEQELHRDLPVTPVPRTLLDLAVVFDFHSLRRALAEADDRDLLDPSPLIAICGRGRPGSAALKRALSAHLPELAETLSVLEERFLTLCESHAITLPEVNATISGLKVDALWRKPRVIVELDGHGAHAGAAAVERDRGRELTLRAAGYRVLRYTWQQVTRRPEHVAADLRAELSARASPPPATVSSAAG